MKDVLMTKPLNWPHSLTADPSRNDTGFKLQQPEQTVQFYDNNKRLVLKLGANGIEVPEGVTPTEAAQEFVKQAGQLWLKLIDTKRLEWLAELLASSKVQIWNDDLLRQVLATDTAKRAGLRFPGEEFVEQEKSGE